MTSLKQHMKYFYFLCKIQLDLPVVITVGGMQTLDEFPDRPVVFANRVRRGRRIKLVFNGAEELFAPPFLLQKWFRVDS